MEIKTRQFKELASKWMKDPSARAFLRKGPYIMSGKRENALKTFPDIPEAQAYGAVIRAEAIARLPELLEEFEKNAAANGAKVIWVRDAKELNETIVKLIKERGAPYVTKGKSMVTEESGLNEVLSENGIEPFETDLGEFIAQLLKRPPFHIVGPAINVAKEEVCEIFMQKAGMKECTTDPVALGYAARLFLREKFHHVQVGITGVNIAVAETGTIINVENEGNIRFTKSSPKTQISVMSLEKVVPTMEDALHMLRLLCRNCTGQRLSAYVSMDSGPKKEGEIDGPEELIIIIVDGGRTKIYQDIKSRDALRCIRCAACLNICPVWRTIGGYAYGFAYSGPMGQVLNPLLLGLDQTPNLYRATTLCGACKSVCPVGIDHPSMFLYYRAKDVLADPDFKTEPRPAMEKPFFKGFAFAVNRSWFWNLGVKLARPFLNRKVQNGFIRKMSGPFSGWFQNKDLPPMAEKTFHDRWKEMQ